MLVTTCPRCGKAMPARLATPGHLHCDACSYSGPPSDEAKPILAATRAHLDAQDQRARQISRSTVDALKKTRSRLLIFLFVLATLPSDWLFCSVLAHLVHPDAWQYDTSVKWAAFASFIAMWSFGFWLYQRHARMLARIRSALSAVPPARSGEAATCRVCGGDLPKGGAVVRCKFCGTDNWADLDVVKSIEKREVTDIGKFATALSFEVASTTNAAEAERKWVMASAFGVPLACLVILDLGVAPLVQRVELPLDESVRYAAAMTRDGECVGRPIRDDHQQFTLDRAMRRYEAPSAMGTDMPPTFSAATLVGKRMRTANVSGIVQKAYGSGIGNFAVVKSDDGVTTDVDIRELCFVTGKVDLQYEGATAFSVVGDEMIFADAHGVSKAKLPDEKATRLFDDSRPTAVGANDTHVFYNNGLVIESVPVEGADAGVVGKLQLDDYIDVLSASSNGRVVGRLGGAGPVVIFGSETKRIAFATVDSVLADGDDVFVGGAKSPGKYGLFRIGSDEKISPFGPDACHSLAADSSTIYCGQRSTVTAVDRASGASIELFGLGENGVTPSNDDIFAITIDGDDLYFMLVHSNETGMVVRIPKKGGVAHVVMDELPFPTHALGVIGDTIIATMNPGHKYDADELVSFPKTPNY